jgi:hypothetical protein
VEFDQPEGQNVSPESTSTGRRAMQDEPSSNTPERKMVESVDKFPNDDRAESSVKEVDEILEEWSGREREQVEKRAEVEAEREQFFRDFAQISQNTIKPAMEAILHRLEQDGGGGLIWEGDLPRTRRPRLILWMSLKGAISGTPRQDHTPYLQLDANVANRRVDVWEGDMWENQGTSRATLPWKLSEISPEKVTERIVGILERAASHNKTP